MLLPLMIVAHSIFHRLDRKDMYRHQLPRIYELLDLIRNPDLESTKSGATVLCEVKTFSPSDPEVRARLHHGGDLYGERLPSEFFNKLTKVINEAVAQLQAHDKTGSARRIVFIVPYFDCL